MWSKTCVAMLLLAGCTSFALCQSLADKAEASEVKIAGAHDKACADATPPAERRKAELQLFRELQNYAGLADSLSKIIEQSDVYSTKRKITEQGLLQKRLQWIKDADDYCSGFPFAAKTASAAENANSTSDQHRAADAAAKEAALVKSIGDLRANLEKAKTAAKDAAIAYEKAGAVREKEPNDEAAGIQFKEAQVAKREADSAVRKLSADLEAEQDLQKNPLAGPDDDEQLGLIAGAEQSGVSSTPNNTEAFVRVFSRSANSIAGNSYEPGDTRLWGQARLLSVPSPSTQGIVSTFTDPTGAVKNLDIKQVGTAIDYIIGTETRILPWKKSFGNYSGHFIVFAGATTPLSSQDVAFRYKVPAAGTAECATILKKFAPALTAGTGASCLSNGINFLAFSREDRSSFLRKYGFGFRTITRFDPDKDGKVQRGVIDFMVAQDEAITGGKLHNWIFRIDGVHPLTIEKFGYLFLFGSAAIRLRRNATDSTLILQGATPTEAPVPSANVLVLPLKQPDRDFFRIGIGFDLMKLFKTAAGNQ
jgi:hypothetical protein